MAVDKLISRDFITRDWVDIFNVSADKMGSHIKTYILITYCLCTSTQHCNLLDQFLPSYKTSQRDSPGNLPDFDLYNKDWIIIEHTLAVFVTEKRQHRSIEYWQG